jgi:hypothetical protein
MLNLNRWVYTNADIYPVMYDTEAGEWMYYGGFYKSTGRVFYHYTPGKWMEE